MANPSFRDVDGAARTGAHFLLEAEDMTLHSGRWDGERFAYSSGQPIDRPIRRYASRERIS